MADAPEVKFQIGAEDGGVANAIKSLVTELKNLKAQEQETAEGALTLGKALDAVIGLESIRKVFEFGKEVFNTAVSIGKLSDVTGVSTETISVFRKVAGDMGVDAERVDRGIIKLSKSLTEFENGTGKSAKAFEALGLKAKDFAGLNTDQKLIKVVTALGSTEGSLRKAGAEAQIFGARNVELNAVMSALAAQGMDKATESTRRLGILFSRDFTDSARTAKAAMNELRGIGEGMAANFEAGLLPAITDIADEFERVSLKGGTGFKGMGEQVGTVLRGVAGLLITVGEVVGSVAQSIVEDFEGAFRLVEHGGVSLFQALKRAAIGDDAGAFKIISQYGRDAARELKDQSDRQVAISTALRAEIGETNKSLFPTADEEKQREATRIEELRLKEQHALEVAAASERLDLIRQTGRNELAQYKAAASLREEQDKASLAAGQLTQEQYFARRKTAIISNTAEEIKILQREREAIPEGGTGAGASVEDIKNAKARADLDSQIIVKRTDGLRALASLNAQVARDQQNDIKERQAAVETALSDELKLFREEAKNRTAADKLAFDTGLLSLADYTAKRRTLLEEESTRELAVLNAKRAAVGPVTAGGGTSEAQARANAKTLESINSEIAIQRAAVIGRQSALEDEAAKQRMTQMQTIANADRTILDIQGKTTEAAREELAVRIEEQRIANAQLSGPKNEEGAARLAQFTQLSTAQINFQEQQKKGQTELNALADEEAAIMLRVQRGEIFELTGREQIEDATRRRLALLQKISTEMAKQANLTGNAELKREAALFQQQLDRQKAEVNEAQQQSMKLKKGIQDALTGGLEQFFTTTIFQAHSVGEAFRSLADSVIMSLQSMVTQMLINLMMTRLLKAAGGLGGGGSAGGMDSSFGSGGMAEGGQVPGRGSGDTVPAWLTPGEFVVRAPAVQMIGLEKLQAINRGMSAPAITRSSTHFAEGGLVQPHDAGKNAPMDLRLHLGLDQGIVLKHMESKAAGKIVVTHLANNPKAAGKALSR